MKNLFLKSTIILTLVLLNSSFMLAQTVIVTGKEAALDAPVIPDKPLIVEEAKPGIKPDIFEMVEVMPEFPGGEKAMLAFIEKNLRMPAEAKKNFTEGRVVLNFVINEDGKISAIKVVRSVKNGCDEEAIRIVKMMPKWKPGMQNGKKVKVLYSLPVTFEQEEESWPEESKNPKFPGGDNAMLLFIKKNLRMPAQAKKNNIQGRVVVNFMVNESGEITDVKLVRGIGYGCDEEAIRVITIMPKWMPGRQNGKNVKVLLSLAVPFEQAQLEISESPYRPPAIVEPPAPAKRPQIFEVVEQMPEFPGGEKALFAFIEKNLQMPAEAKKNGISGRVVVNFVINETGEISDVKVVRGIKYGCDEEAMRIIKLMPKWKPGKQNAVVVKVYYSLPITFQDPED